MKHLATFALFLIAACAVSARAGTENVYRCGSNYSQAPCPEGTPVDVQDARTPAQKAESDAATRRDAKTANAMEKSRLKEEARLQAAKAAAAAEKKAAKPVKPEPHATHPKKKTKKREPDYFTARGATEEKPKAPGSKNQ